MDQVASTGYKALSLEERIASLSLIHPNFESILSELDEVQLAQSERRLKRWRSQAPFTEEATFQKRLIIEGLNEEKLRYLLGETTDHIVSRCQQLPSWLHDLNEAFASYSAPTVAKAAIESSNAGHIEDSFIHLIQPLISFYRKRLYTGVCDLLTTYPSAPFDPSHIEDICIKNTLPHLQEILCRTMTLELHVARLNKQLSGTTPQERFASFIGLLGEKDRALSLLEEYPVLARAVITCLQLMVSVTLEMLTRLCKDWQQVMATFCHDEQPGTLTAIEADMGDQHRNGHTVMILTFSSKWRVVYKPRSLAIEQHFQQLLQWLNERGQPTPFLLIHLLDCGDYGWCQYIQHEPCTSPEQVQRFYMRQGSYLALLHILAATDYHNENIIAMGEHPMLIDLESLFHPYVDGIREDAGLTDNLAGKLLSQSVLRIGMLPSRDWEYRQSAGIDMSGLGSIQNQLSPRKAQYWQNEHTDEMTIARKRLPIPETKTHRPMLVGIDAPISVHNYRHEVISGFTATYKLLVSLREELLGERSILERFMQDEIRVLLRPTYIYSLLLRESYHPDVLRDALDRERFFDKLWVHTVHFPFLMSVIAAERRDLWQGDIPIFLSTPQQRDIWTSAGERISNFLQQPAIETVREHLYHLNAEDLRWQSWLISASFTALSMNEKVHAVHSYAPFSPSATVDTPRFLVAACVVGDRLEKLALYDGPSASWIGLHPFQERYWKIAPLGLDLYGGLPGVAFFLAYLGQATGTTRYTALAQAALTNIRHQIAQKNSVTIGIGAFGGRGGLIYLLVHLAVLWQQADLLMEADSLVQLLASKIDQDDVFDVIDGAAGSIGALSVLYQYKPSDALLTVMKRCGDHLIAHAQPVGGGIGWASYYEKNPLAGFSHGAAGVAWALLKLSILSGESRFRDAACAAIAYEQSLFSPTHNNWRDLREDGSDPFVGWCHGAAGIGMARLASLSYLDTKEVRQDIKCALQATLSDGFGANHSLCHGDAGNLDFLLQAASQLHEPDLQSQVDEKAALFFESIERFGYLSGVPLSVETPGLLVGLAGIGHGLLRCAAPTSLPSVLILEPPISCSRH